MKKILPVCLLLLFTAALIYAQEGTKPKIFTLGFGIGSNIRTYKVEDPDDVIKNTYYIFGFSLFFDAKFARFSVAGGFPALLKIDQNGLRAYNLISGAIVDFMLIGKYPFSIGRINIWPGVGLKYSLFPYVDLNGDHVSEWPPEAAYNDLYLMLGAGLDINRGKRFVLSGLLFININLTPKTADNPPSDADYHGLEFEMKLDFGWRF